MDRDSAAVTSIGKKFLMALTGLMLSGFVVGHLLGNLTIFGGRELINTYAYHLEELKVLIWVARITLLVLVSLHIIYAICLSIENRKARPIGYAQKKDRATSTGARTMAITGTIVLAFIVFHLMHFTFRVTHPEISNGVDINGHRDVYLLVVMSFQDPALTAVYLTALTLLFFHLSHGLWSLFQSLGILGEQTLPLAKKAAGVVSFLVYLGYISIPVACYFGWIKV